MTKLLSPIVRNRADFILCQSPNTDYPLPNNKTHMRTLLCLLAITSSALAQAPAPAAAPTQPLGQQQQQQQPNTTRPIWRANLPGGTYEIVVGAMVSVSSHEYVVDGTARVTEVNVDTTGQMAVRFYYIEPAMQSGPAGIGAATFGKVQGLATEAAERSGSDAWKKVVKSYPTTTHARTVEYRLASKDALNKIFASADKSLRNGKPDEVTITE